RRKNPDADVPGSGAANFSADRGILEIEVQRCLNMIKNPTGGWRKSSARERHRAGRDQQHWEQKHSQCAWFMELHGAISFPLDSRMRGCRLPSVNDGAVALINPE